MSSIPHNEIVVDQYDSQAGAYLASSVHANGQELSRLASLVRARSDGVALDLGCGAGHLAYRLAPLFGQVLACDLSPAMLEAVAAEARRRGLANIATRQCAAEDLPFPSASFDLVATRYSAHHWRNLAAGLAGMHRVLKPGGQALFFDVVAPESTLADTWLQTIELLRDPSHVRDASLSEWCRHLEAAGYRIGEIVSSRQRLEFLPWIERMRTPAVHVAAIRALLQRAGSEVAGTLQIEADGSFTVDTALILASRD